MSIRLFLNSGVYPAYRKEFERHHPIRQSFRERMDAYLRDRFGAPHILKPVLDGDNTAFFSYGDDDVLQRAWAREHGFKKINDLSAILLAQIEHHQAEVFYNLDPMRFGSDFVRRLPGCVKRSVCWRAAPSPGADFSTYDLIVCNFPSIIASWQDRGWRAEYFSPAHDPVMDEYAGAENRPIDVIFIGGYSRHHQSRALVLEAVAGLSGRYDVRFHLDRSRMNRLAESTFARLLPLGKHRRPSVIRMVSREPVFGRRLYELLGSAKIVLNGAIDMAGTDRGNMRCFEAMGASALLVSDTGVYPRGMNPGETLLAYSTPIEAARLVELALGDWNHYAGMASKGNRMMKSLYSKERQWHDFKQLLDTI